MRVEISIGEAVDKLSILELKNNKISDEGKKLEIQKEIKEFAECVVFKHKYEYYYKLLMFVNSEMWTMTDTIKSMDVIDTQYASLANMIFEFNQKRYRLKNFFNILTESNIKEQKSYISTSCKLIIDNEDILYDKLSEISYLSLDYDILLCDDPWFSTIKKLLQAPNIKLSDDTQTNCKIIQLSEYNITSQLKDAFELIPISYISGGMFGDYIQQLSVINENFYKLGRKGILYITEAVGDTFRNGVEATYKDTYDTIKAQKYIKEYKIFEGGQCHVDLSIWRYSHLTFKTNWYNIFTYTYNIKWGSHKWLSVPVDKKWENTVFINMPSHRFSTTFDYNKLYSMYGKSLVYLTHDPKDYEHFKSRTNLDIDCYYPSSFTDTCIAINSCKLLAGGLSGMLTIAHACHKDRIICLYGGADIFNTELDKIWPNIKYTI